MTLWGQRWHAE